MKAERSAELESLARRLGHDFADLGRLDRALTHTSHANEAGPEVRHN